jgi:uncharacterized membrane protein
MNSTKSTTHCFWSQEILRITLITREIHMSSKSPKLIATLLFVLALSSAVFATDYRYSRIDVPNSRLTILRGINARGDILGSYVGLDGVSHDFLLRNGIFSNIVYPGGTGAARAMNARGDIVGGFGDADGGHGFLLRDGKLTKIDYPGASSTIAFGINNTGDIAGQYLTAAGTVRGFLLSDGTFHTIYVNGGPNLGVHGAQDNGRVMIGDVKLTSDQSNRAYRKLSNDVLLLDPPGTIFPCSHARVINERGDIAGAFGIVNSAAECHAPNHGFVFRDGVYDIIDPPGSHDTFVFGMNDDGIVVGVLTDQYGHVHGFKARP